MSKRIPVTRQTSWMMAIPTFTILLVLVIGSAALFWAEYDVLSVAIGCGVYLLYSYGSKFLLTQPHRQGMKLSQQGRFHEAIEKFEQSYAFFSRHSWIDQYRPLTLLSSSAIGYRESSLINTAVCHSQLGEGQQAKAYYERALAEFPNSSMAEVALNLIRSVEKKDDE